LDGDHLKLQDTHTPHALNTHQWANHRHTDRVVHSMLQVAQQQLAQQEAQVADAKAACAGLSVRVEALCVKAVAAANMLDGAMKQPAGTANVQLGAGGCVGVGGCGWVSEQVFGRCSSGRHARVLSSF
jgi:hypothetical protein